MTTLSEIEKLAQESRSSAIRTAITLFRLPKESRSSAIRTAITLFRLPKEYPNELIETMIDSIITAAMMETAAMQVKIVEDAEK